MTAPTSDPQPTRRRSLAAALLAGVFCAGLAGGAGGAFLFFQNQVRHVLTAPAAAPAPIDRLLIVWEKRLAADLRLSESERASVHDSLTQTGVRLKDLRARSASELQDLVRHAIEDVGANLPPEKAERARADIRARLAPWGLGGPAPTPDAASKKKM